MTARGEQQTAGRDEVYAALVAYIDEHGYPPTMRELAELTGHASPSTIHHHLHALAAAGRVRLGSTYAMQVAIVRD